MKIKLHAFIYSFLDSVVIVISGTVSVYLDKNLCRYCSHDSEETQGSVCAFSILLYIREFTGSEFGVLPAILIEDFLSISRSLK